jgi:hypothetical protein
MARLIARTAWTSQPQISVGSDRGNFLCSGLVFLTMPGKLQVNLVDGKAFAGTSGIIETSSRGIGAYASAPTTYPTVTATLGQNYTLFSLGNVTTLGVAGSMIDDDDGSTRAFLFRIVVSGAPDFTPFTSGNVPVGITGAAFTAAQLSAGVTVAATMDSVGNGAVWGNGTKTTGSLGAAPRAPSTTIALLNRKVGGTQIPTTKPVHMCAGWNRVLSDAELLSLSFNPWQLFAPLTRTLWAPASAGVPDVLMGQMCL